MSVRILIAEDYQPFLRFLSLSVEGRPGLQVVCEVTDGLEATRKARQLKPDLVLLDIGIPSVNGIEAARRIHVDSPNSKILFVSQESSPEVIQAALETGAQGYVSKSDVGRELFAALDAVLRGQIYLSRSVGGNDLTRPSNTPAPNGVGPCVIPQLPGHRGESTRLHEVGFYSDDSSLLEGFANFVGAALKNGKAAIFIGTASHRSSLLSRLHAYGLDMTAAMETGRYVALDNAAAVSEIMVNGLPDPSRFYRVTDGLITRTAKSVNGEYARVVACGECAPYLWARGNAEGALRLEHLWDEVAQQYGIHILCGYPLVSFQGGIGSYTFSRICAKHSAVVSPLK